MLEGIDCEPGQEQDVPNMWVLAETTCKIRISYLMYSNFKLIIQIIVVATKNKVLAITNCKARVCHAYVRITPYLIKICHDTASSTLRNLASRRCSRRQALTDQDCRSTLLNGKKSRAKKCFKLYTI